MCTNRRADAIAQAVAACAKDMLGDRLECVVLYDSYARGDFDDESDVDLMVRVRCDKEELTSLHGAFIKIASELSLKYGVEVSVSLTDTATFNRYKHALPYYENVEREGVRIA